MEGVVMENLPTVYAELGRTVRKQGPVEMVLFDIDGESKILMQGIETLIFENAEDIGNDAMMRIGFGRSFNLYDPKALKLLQGHIHTYFGAKGILATLRLGLAEILAEGYRLGETMEQLAKRVTQTFSAYTKGDAAKARMIARSETIRASNAAQLEAFKQSGVVTGKVWHASPDACEWCLDLADMSEVALDDAWQSGAKDAEGNYSFDPVDFPPLHPHCRCALVAVTA